MIVKKYFFPIYWNNCSESEKKTLLMRPNKNTKHINSKVNKILNQVLQYGDKSVIKYNLEFDHTHTPQLKIPLETIKKSKNYLSNNIKEAIHTAINNITQFHQLQCFKEIDVEIVPGVRCKQISRPIHTVGLYIPGGSAPLPSTVIMLGVPASIAQCNKIILCSPPPISNVILYAAQVCGITEIYQIGGSQAIAAMGFGTESVPKVDKIFGPGNIWVTEAKRQIIYRSNKISIDMLAGPSELLIIADHTANPVFIAADLLSQAEHGIDSHVILVTPDINIANQTYKELHKQLKMLNRIDIINQSLVHSRIIITNNIMECFAINNHYSPEHLSIHMQHSQDYLQYILNAGSIFLGQWSAESAGDYASGPNHVLPTYGNAVTISGLSVNDFQKRISVQQLTHTGLLNLSETITTLAQTEQLQAHEYAITRRINHIKGII